MSRKIIGEEKEVKLIVYKNQIKKILEKKSVNNGMWLYLLQFFNTVVPLITIPYITRILGANQYGVFSIVLNIVTYLQVVVEYGFGLSATRQVVLRSDKDDLSKLFSQVFFSRLLLFGLSFGSVMIYVLASNITIEEKLCYVILTSALVGYCFQQNWLFQGMQEMKFISITSVLARGLTTVFIFLLVKTPDDILIYCILYSLAPVISNILAMIIAMCRYKVKIVVVKWIDIIQALKDGMYIFFTQLSSKVFGSIGITLLGIFSTSYDVGIFSALYKIPYLLTLVWSPISQAIYPISSEKIMKSFAIGYKFICKIRLYCIAFFAVIGCIISIFAIPICSIAFGEEYSRYFYVIYPLIAWVIVAINNNFLGTQILVGSGHDKEYSICFQIGIVFTIVMNVICVYFGGMLGAGFAPMLSEIFLWLLLRYCVKKMRKDYSQRQGEL